MATKTSLLGLSKPAYTDAADIAVINANMDLIDNAVGQQARAENMLDNSDWRYSRYINQRGYSGTFEGTADATTRVIDRWKTWSTYNTYTFSSSGITVTNSHTSSIGPYQEMETPSRMKGKTYTLVMSYDGGTIISGTASVPTATSSSTIYKTAVSATSSRPGLRFEISGDLSSVKFQALIYPGMSHEIEWMALYEGAYTADNLPTYVYKGYAAEWNECRRYFRVDYAVCTVGTQYGTTTKGVITIAITGMRALKSDLTILSVTGQGWGTIAVDNLTQGWNSKTAGLCYCNYTIDGSTSYIGQTILVRYEATGDL